MSDLEQIFCKKNNKNANATVPHIYNVLVEHRERLLKIENVIKTGVYKNFKEEAHPQQPVVQELPDFDKIINNRIDEILKQCKDHKIDVERVVVEVVEDEKEEIKGDDFEIEIKEIEEELQAIVEPVEPDLPNPLISELTDKLSDLTNQNIILGDEIRSIERLEDEDDDILSLTDTESQCTDACAALLTENADIMKVGSWKCEDELCNGCIKTRAKAFKKEKKEMEKKRAKELKEIKKRQKELIKEEQKQLSIRLKNLKKNRDENYGIDMTRQEQMKRELQKIADDYQKLGASNASFNVQLFV
jgi:hypothetical protein